VADHRLIPYKTVPKSSVEPNWNAYLPFTPREHRVTLVVSEKESHRLAILGACAR